MIRALWIESPVELGYNSRPRNSRAKKQQIAYCGLGETESVSPGLKSEVAPGIFMKKLVIVIVSVFIGSVMPQLTLAQGDAAAGQAKSALCSTCHGSDGNSELAVNPKLAGQSASYLVKQMTDYKSGARSNPTMSAMVLSLSDEDMQDIAAWYSSQQVTLQGADPEALQLGESLYRAGNKELSVAACSACHSPTGQGNAPAGFPSLSGQHAEYTLQQLKNFRAGERQNDLSSMMRSVVERLTDKELEALASYVSGLN
jgi:cytochrome c553